METAPMPRSLLLLIALGYVMISASLGSTSEPRFMGLGLSILAASKKTPASPATDAAST